MSRSRGVVFKVVRMRTIRPRRRRVGKRPPDVGGPSNDGCRFDEFQVTELVQKLKETTYVFGPNVEFIWDKDDPNAIPVHVSYAGVRRRAAEVGQDDGEVGNIDIAITRQIAEARRLRAGSGGDPERDRRNGDGAT
jgi:hypothetical protein